MLLRHRADAGGQRRPCTALRAVLAVGGLWLLVYQPRQVFGPQVLVAGGCPVGARDRPSDTSSRSSWMQSSRCVTTFSSATKSFDDLRPSVLHAAGAFFFCVFCAFSWVLWARRPNRCRGRWHSIGLPSYCALAVSPCSWGSLRAAVHCQSLSLGGARRAIYFFGDVFGGVLPGVVLLGDRWRDSSRPAALAQSRRRSATPLESS